MDSPSEGDQQENLDRLRNLLASAHVSTIEPEKIGEVRNFLESFGPESRANWSEQERRTAGKLRLSIQLARLEQGELDVGLRSFSNVEAYAECLSAWLLARSIRSDPDQNFDDVTARHPIARSLLEREDFLWSMSRSVQLPDDITDAANTADLLYDMLRRRFDAGRTIRRVSDLAQSYRFLQLSIGIVAATLAIAVPFLDWMISGQPLRDSLSAYYHGSSGALFVGALFLVGLLFLSYQRQGDGIWIGADKWNAAAGVLAIGIAIFPTTDGMTGEATRFTSLAGIFHGVFALGFFLIISRIALRWFEQARIASHNYSPESIGSNSGWWKIQQTLYLVCGIGIPIIIVAGVIFGFWLDLAEGTLGDAWLFWGELVMMSIFSATWLGRSGFFSFVGADIATPVEVEEYVYRSNVAVFRP